MSVLRRRSVVVSLLSVGVLIAPVGAAAVAAPAHRAGAIRSVAPRVERPGRTVVITGSGFQRVRAVRFHGRKAHFRVVSSHKIRAQVPAKATTGRVTVVTAAGTLTSPSPMVVAPKIVAQAATAPTLTGFTPTSGIVNTLVTLTGTGFTSPATVSFNGASTTGTVVSATTITASVPSTATTGPLKVTTAGSTLTGSTFTVTTGVGLTVKSGPPASSIGVYGSGFGPLEAVDLYAGTTDVALVSANSAGSFSYSGFQIPGAAQPGTLQITAIGRHSGISAQAPFTVRTDWAQQGFGTDHKGVNPYENTVGTGNVSALGRAWSTKISGGTTGVAIVNNIAYAGSSNRSLYAVNATTGAVLWSYLTGSSIYSTPSVVNNIVYVGSEDDKLYALNASTGALLWSYATGSGIAQSSPTVANGLVYVGSNDKQIYALNATSGALVWKYATGGYISDSVAVSNGLAFVGSADSKIYALNASTGAFVWSYTTGAVVVSSPAVYDGFVYAGSTDDKLYAINALTGGLVWTATTGGVIYTAPVVTNNLVYVGSSDDKLYAYNAFTGALVWTFTTRGPIYSAGPAVANGVVYFGSYDYQIYGVAANTGALLWTFATGSYVNSSPSIVNGDLYATSYDGNLYSFTLPAGTSPNFGGVTLGGGLNPNVAHRVSPASLQRNSQVKVTTAGRGSTA